MKSKHLIGRSYEWERLEQCLHEEKAQLVIVYGRRRVGKTFLVNEFFDNQFTFKLTGSYDKPRDYQLRNFTAELRRKSNKELKEPKDWIEAFEMLRAFLEKLPKKQKKIVFFDEMPWLDTHKSGFLSAFEFFWNDWASTCDNLVFIACGSASSWMTEKIDKNKGGLFNRQSCRLYLEPFTLKQTEEYLKSKGIEWSRYEIAECYMIMGGIPYYLNLLHRNYSYTQNIDRLFFKNKGELWDEFEHLYHTLFTNSENYIKVVSALSKKNKGLTRNEIINEIKHPNNGTLSIILDNLVSSGFVRISSFYGNKSKEKLYQLSDYYTMFYFKYIKGHYGKDEHFWSNAIDNPSRRAWAGYTFEQLCKDHTAQIKQKLGISGVLTEESSWATKGDTDLGIPGTQIDLLIDRRDNIIDICEMKFSLNEFIVDKKYDMDLRNKVDTFRRMTNTRKSIQIVMVSTYGIKQNKYSSFIQNEVLLNDLFN